MKIEVLGPGCARCQALEANVRQALAEAGCVGDLSHVTDAREIGRRGVMLTPALVIDGRVKVSGRVPTVAEIRLWVQPAAAHKAER